jgi:CubicO group peptidase (beta-lactamase class C family)
MHRNLCSRFNFIIILISFLIMLNPLISFAQSKADKIDQFMTRVYENRQFNGTVLVAENGKVIYKKGFGLGNMDWNMPNKPDTKFRIASVTKQFVAMQIMQLVEEGKIKLDGKLSDYLPEYRKDTGEKITIHHLLTHTSGIPSYTGLTGFWSDSTRNPYTIEYMIEHFHSGDLEFEPGTDYKYNNTGYYLLAVIIERITGKTYEENLIERIITPVNMTNSGIDRNQRIIYNRAIGYYKQLTGYIHDPYFLMTNAYGAGDMYSTVEDLYLWDQALYTENLLSDKYKEIMFTPFLSNYAYGWGVYYVSLGENDDSVKVVSHSGGLNGFNTRIFRLIEDKHLIVLLNNTGGTVLLDMCRELTKILYDRPYAIPKMPLSEPLGKTLQKQNIQAALGQYHDLKKNHYNEYVFDENALNTFGYQLINLGRVDDAIEIFKLNITEYPDAFNPYDSLGEGYMIKGEWELAIKYYAKSLEMNPKNTNAINRLHTIQSSMK